MGDTCGMNWEKLYKTLIDNRDKIFFKKAVPGTKTENFGYPPLAKKYPRQYQYNIINHYSSRKNVTIQLLQRC